MIATQCDLILAVFSLCSRDWGFCLMDEPTDSYHYPYPDKPPGILYDVNHQCRLQYGSNAEHCDGIEVNAFTFSFLFIVSQGIWSSDVIDLLSRYSGSRA